MVFLDTGTRMGIDGRSPLSPPLPLAGERSLKEERRESEGRAKEEMRVSGIIT